MKNILVIISILYTSLSFTQGDCPAVCLTTGGSFTAQDGSIDEINNINRGCLSADEATSSYWIRLCFTTAGTFSMTITPQGSNNDFDFAVWNGTNCPPTTAPIKCSFSSIGGATGMRATNPGTPTGCGFFGLFPCPATTNTDNSEGVGGNSWVAPLNATAGQCITILVSNYGSGSDNFSISFSGTATISPCSALPVDLINFTVENVQEENILNWITSYEENNFHFIIEHSLDLIEFTALGRVNGLNFPTMYEFGHAEYKDGTNYYRLLQVDFDGAIKYYDPIVITNKKDEILKVYNILGQEVDLNEQGLIIILYKSGKIIKQINKQL